MFTSLHGRHDRELAKVKEMITAQERVKREKWIEEKTKKIKVREAMVRRLSPFAVCLSSMDCFC